MIAPAFLIQLQFLHPHVSARESVRQKFAEQSGDDAVVIRGEQFFMRQIRIYYGRRAGVYPLIEQSV